MSRLELGQAIARVVLEAIAVWVRRRPRGRGRRPPLWVVVTPGAVRVMRDTAVLFSVEIGLDGLVTALVWLLTGRWVHHQEIDHATA